MRPIATRAPSCILHALLLLTLLSACGKTELKPGSTQVAAKVNVDEITIHQVNLVLAKMANVTPETANSAKRNVLDRLIEQQLAKQQAIAKHIDRAPTVVQALEAARDEILARAYLERIVEALPKPTAGEISAYYAAHSELFSRRRVFSLEEIAALANEDIAAALRERVAKARSIQEIAEWLESQGVKFSPNRGVLAAEQLPLEMLPKLQEMRDGDIRLFGKPDGRLQVIRMVASRAEPVEEAAAAQRIRQFLSNQRANEAVAMEMKRLKQQAKIEYVGEFAEGAAVTEAKRKAQSEAAKNGAIPPMKMPQQIIDNGNGRQE